MADSTVYERLGSADGLRALVHRFYQVMDQDARAAGIRRMHPPDLARSEDSLYKFLSGWFGGPPLYIEERGHPRLRMRHFPFAIGVDEAAAWMHCMRIATAEHIDDVHLRAAIDKAFDDMAQHMVNQVPATGHAQP